MAVVQWTGLTTAMKGKLRGSVFQAGAAGQVLRSNNNFNQAGNPRWNGSKLNIGQTVQLWKSLSPTDRATWAAATVNFPTKDRFGNTHYPSPYTLHNRLNSSLLYHTATFNSAAPVPQPFPNLGTLAATAASPSTMLLTWTFPSGTDFLVVVNASSCISPGRSANRSVYTLISTYNIPSAVSQSIATDYITRWGQISAGCVIHYKITLLSTISGQMSPAYYASAYT